MNDEFVAGGHVPAAAQPIRAGYCRHVPVVIKPATVPAGVLRGRKVAMYGSAAAMLVVVAAGTLGVRYGSWPTWAFSFVGFLVALAAVVRAAHLSGWIAGYRAGYVVERKDGADHG